MCTRNLVLESDLDPYSVHYINKKRNKPLCIIVGKSGTLKVEAFIRILNKNNSLGARSQRSLKLFTHLLASAETSQECLLALLNVKATIRPGSMRDKFMNIGFHLLERASRLLNYNKVKNGAKVFSFASESPRTLTSNS